MVAPLVEQYACKMPSPGIPAVDPATGQMSLAWWNWALRMFSRTGEQVGVGSTETQSTANTALANAAAASATATSAQTAATAAAIAAGTAQTTATNAQTTADTATTDLATETTNRIAGDATNATAIATETAARIAADALLAPKASPSFTGNALVAGGIGVWGHAAPGTQPAAPVTLANVISVLQAYGFTA